MMSEHRLPVTAYERAERMLGHNRDRLALRSRVTPKWIGDGSTFWYRVDTERGTEFIVADPEAPSPDERRRPAFDHERLARSLAAASGTGVEPYDLPFRTIEIAADTVSFDAFETRWTCRLPGYDCARDDRHRPRTPLEVPSPDGRWVAFRRGHDLWLRSLRTDRTAAAAAGTSGGAGRVIRDEFAVTTDGTAERPYACNPDSAGDRWWLRMIGIFEEPPVVLWSPDSSRLLFHVVDQSGVAPMHLVEAAPARVSLLDAGRDPAARPVAGLRCPVTHAGARAGGPLLDPLPLAGPARQRVVVGRRDGRVLPGSGA
jgi:dipeptidyl-peptidase 4